MISLSCASVSVFVKQDNNSDTIIIVILTLILIRVFTNHIGKMPPRYHILLQITNIDGNVLDYKCPRSASPTGNYLACDGTWSREPTVLCSSDSSFRGPGLLKISKFMHSRAQSIHITASCDLWSQHFARLVCWLITKKQWKRPQLRPLVIFTWASHGGLTWLKRNRVKAQKKKKKFEKNILINSKTCF